MIYKFAPMVSLNTCEIDYLLKILNLLKNKLSDDYYFIIARTNNIYEISQFRKEILEDKKNILILLSDEAGIMPPFLDKLYMVFRTYNHRRLYDGKKIFPIPCGYCAQVGLNKLPNPESKYINSETIHKNVTEREYDIFYSGQLGSDRYQMKEQLLKIKDNYKSYVQITNEFGTGLCSEKYFEFLNNSKISIVPMGAVVPESFRYFESFESGCIVLTSYPFYNRDYVHWYYEKSPAIKLNSWIELNNKLIDYILENQVKLQEDSVYYYKNYLSSEAVSNYIIEKLI